MYKPYIFVAF